MKTKLLYCYINILMVYSAFAQVKIGDNPTLITPSAVFEAESTDKGILIPRIDLQANAPVNPAKSLLVWNTNTSLGEGFYYYDGAQWQRLGDPGTFGWSLSGNSATNPNTDFLGTTDNQRLVFKTNNIPRMVVGNDQAGSFTNLSLSANPNTNYSGGSLTSFNTIIDAQNGTQAVNLFGIENLLYLRSGSSLNTTDGVMRGLRNRLWNIQTSNYPTVQGVYNDYRGEVTDITDYKGFTNYMDMRSGSNITNYYGYTTEFNQLNGTIANYYGFSNYPRQSNLANYTNYYGFYQSNLGSSASRYAFYYDATASGTKKVVITSAGNIGIGTTTPAAGIEITGSNPLKMNNVSAGTATDELLSINATGEVRKVPMVSTTTVTIANLTLPAGNGVVRHNYDIGLSGANNNATIFKISGTTQQFTITGFAGGTNGRVIQIFNSAANGNMIITN
jgi:hypothetical protein